MNAEKIKDRAAMIYATMIADGGTRAERATDAVHSALAIERAVDEILAAPANPEKPQHVTNRYGHLS